MIYNLCRGWPKGKINEFESGLSCAIRETFEETGFDATDYCVQENFISNIENEKITTLYIATGVPESTIFEPQTRKEVSKVEFHPIDDLPKNSYNVKPFIHKIKKWIEMNGHKYKNKYKAKDNNTKKTKSNILNIDDKNTETFSSSDSKGWEVNDMFKINSQITGKKFEYDGIISI